MADTDAEPEEEEIAFYPGSINKAYDLDPDASNSSLMSKCKPTLFAVSWCPYSAAQVETLGATAPTHYPNVAQPLDGTTGTVPLTLEEYVDVVDCDNPPDEFQYACSLVNEFPTWQWCETIEKYPIEVGPKTAAEVDDKLREQEAYTQTLIQEELDASDSSV